MPLRSYRTPVLGGSVRSNSNRSDRPLPNIFVADGVFAFLVDAEVEAGLCDPLTVPLPCG
jgi:hypothetical protein